MRIPSKSFSGLYDPRLHTKDFPYADPTQEGHFAGASQSVVRQVQFAAGTGDRNVELWRTPSQGEYIIEGAYLELTNSWSQVGAAAQMEVSIQIERKVGSGQWFTLVLANLPSTSFAADAYDISANPNAWGGQAWQAPIGAHWVENTLLAFDGRIPVTAVNATEIFTVTDGDWCHGLATDEPLIPKIDVGGTLPTGLSSGTIVYARSPTDKTFQVAAAPGGAAINITTDGTSPFYFFPIEKGVNVGHRGIYVSGLASRFRGAKVRLRARTLSGSNSWSGNAQVSLQLRMIR